MFGVIFCIGWKLNLRRIKVFAMLCIIKILLSLSLQMVQAIQVLRFHLLELEKVSETFHKTTNVFQIFIIFFIVFDGFNCRYENWCSVTLLIWLIQYFGLNERKLLLIWFACNGNSLILAPLVNSAKKSEQHKYAYIVLNLFSIEMKHSNE